MKRKLIIANKNELEFELSPENDSNGRTWYFVHWDNQPNVDGYYIIYTYRTTFGKSSPIFMSKDFKIICKVGNMINGLFHSYFNISDSYPLTNIVLDDLIQDIKSKGENNMEL